MTAVHTHFVVATALSRCTSTTANGRKCGLEEGKTNAGVHDDNKAERGKVDVSKQDSGVDLPHLLTGPILPAPVKGTRLTVVAEDYSHRLFLRDLEHDPRRTHDEHGQDPYDDNNQL